MIRSYIADDWNYQEVNWGSQSACKVCLFASVWTFSTLYVNLWNCLPANVYLNTPETASVYCDCEKRWCVCLSFSILAGWQAVSELPGKWCFHLWHLKKTEKDTVEFSSFPSLCLCSSISFLAHSHLNKNWHLSSVKSVGFIQIRPDEPPTGRIFHLQILYILTCWHLKYDFFVV